MEGRAEGRGAEPRGGDQWGGQWDAVPLVLLDGQRVRVATAAAGEARVRAGMTVAEARSRCAALRVALWDEETIAHEVTRVTAALVGATPQVSPAAGTPGIWWGGATGFESSGGERALAEALAAIARRWHPGARVGVADSCVAARAATWDGGYDRAAGVSAGVILVPPGGCAAYLASAPLGMVPMEEELRETLLALGVRTVGGFAALAAEDVERRWGATGVAAWRLAHGVDRRRPVLARLDAPRAVSAELHPSAHTMEPVLFLVRAALDRLVQELVADARAAAVVAITLTLDDARGPLPGGGPAHTVTREVRLSRPLARAVPLFERCRALLDDWTLSAPAAGVCVAITATAPLAGEQGELLDPAWRDPAAADAAFARLRATLGTDAVVRPVVRDTHRPEAAGGWERVDDGGAGGAGGTGGTSSRPPLSPPTSSSPTATTATPAVGGGRGDVPRAFHPPAGPPLALVGRLSLGAVREAAIPLPSPPPPSIPARPATPALPVSPISPATPEKAASPLLPHRPALRQLDPPQPLDVACQHDVPHLLRWGGRGVRVGRAIGPERLAGDWWDDGYARDYWRCEDATGMGDLLIYRERPPGEEDRWFIHGWYD